MKCGADAFGTGIMPTLFSTLDSAVAVTEPDYGSDVASLKVTAKRDGDFYVINGVKTWCTFGGRANLLQFHIALGVTCGDAEALSCSRFAQRDAVGIADHVALGGSRPWSRARPDATPLA